jgi:hypothetical protein
MFFMRRNPHRIAGADFPDRATLGLHPSDAMNDKKRLSERMGVPRRTRARLECDACGIDPRRGWRSVDRILQTVPVNQSFDARRVGREPAG